MQYKVMIVLVFGLLSFTISSSSSSATKNARLSLANFEFIADASIENTYHLLKTNNLQLPPLELFKKGLMGFYQFKEKGIIQNDILTLVDFSLSSTVKRLWVIDLKNNLILFQSLVAHGRNSGNEFAHQFSNKSESYQSSLGFYATAETYIGKHGYSLRLDGLENGINHKARERAIVIHGADYVSETFIQQNGRLGRSFGCPSLPMENYKEIIDLIKNKSCLFIYFPAK
ncbi:MAG: murein L,D-transpeptidase catalytic domain family protein [Flavobacteriaceae bacterium]|nr:murein L,D-transpeptidase catalytic domain family protein [Flavobacteriaceae bacterium]